MKHTGMAADTACEQFRGPVSAVFVSRYLYPFTGGLEKRVGTIAAGLAARGVRVAVLTGRLSPEFPFEHIQGGVTIYRFACPRVKVIGACVFIAQIVLYLIRQRSRYQAVHAFQVGHSAAAAVLTGRLLGKPVFLHLSGGGSGGDVGRHVKTPWGWMFLCLCRLASRIIVLNARMQRELKVIAYPAARTVCIPNGVDSDCFRPHAERLRLRRELGLPEGPVVLYTGRISPEKGVEVLVRAFAQLRSPASPALCILGDGPARQRIERLVRGLGLQGAITLLPARADILPWYQAADVFVMPSFHEGMSNSILEAMACALPVVATAVSGTAELVRHGESGLLVPPGDPASLAAALDDLLGDPGRARDMGIRGRGIVRTQYSGTAMIERYYALYGRQDLHRHGGR